MVVFRALTNFYLVAAVVYGCGDSRAGITITLADPCDTPMQYGVAVRLSGGTMLGAIRQIHPLSSRSQRTRVGIEADSGLYAGSLEGDSITVERRVAKWGREDEDTLIAARGEILRVDAMTEGEDGTIVVFDWQLQRITRWAPSGRVDQVLTLRLGSLADDYVGGRGTVVAVASHTGSEPYASTTGELRSLDRLGYPDSLLATFPSLVVRLKHGPLGAKYLRRPLEHQPIIRWSSLHGWVIASTDSLHIQFGGAERQRLIAGRGARAPIDRIARDSSIEAYVRTTGATRPDRMEARRRFARENLFRARTRLQLIDDVVPMVDGRFAVRRMRLCPDRHGWNVIDSVGRPAGVFAVPLAYVRAITHGMDGILFTVRRDDSLALALVPVLE